MKYAEVKMMNNIYYDENETMKMIGFQVLDDNIDNAMFQKDFNNMIKVHNNNAKKCNTYDLVFNTAYDAFLLGVIYGKRAERTKCNK